MSHASYHPPKVDSLLTLSASSFLSVEARRTYKGVMSVPRMVMPTDKAEDSRQSKRKIVQVDVNEADSDAKKVKVV